MMVAFVEKLTPTTRERLAKLVGMLAASNDGEVLNAARAITSTLKAAGADINDLAVIVKGASQAIEKPIQGQSDTRSIYLRMAHMCLERVHDPNTTSYLKHAVSLLENGRMLSAAQTSWLVDIYARRY